MPIDPTVGGGVPYGMLMVAIMQLCSRTQEQAIVELAWYDDEVPVFTSLEGLNAFAVEIDAKYQEAQGTL